MATEGKPATQAEQDGDLFANNLVQADGIATVLTAGFLTTAEEDGSPPLALAVAYMRQLDNLEAEWPGVKEEAARLYEPVKDKPIEDVAGP